MPRRHLRLVAADSIVDSGLRGIRSEMRIPEEFPPAVIVEATGTEPRLPDLDLTDVPFVTIDPPGARDLDQAVHVSQRRGGYRVLYAIADVGAFVEPGGMVDLEARERGQTLYGPDRRTLLYPPGISEDRASLLADRDRPALVWEVDLGPDGEVVDGRVRRAIVRSREQLSYPEVQEQLDSDEAPGMLDLLAEIGRLRQLLDEERGAVTLDIPEQQVVPDDGGWSLRFRGALPVEGWNAQISLLTGMCAARMMVEAGMGLLRTLPPAERERVERLRRIAGGLRIAWPNDLAYPDFVRSLDGRIPAHAAFLTEATSLFAGAGYQVLGPEEVPRPHSALATLYAHVTAPLRRLADRFTGEVCLAISEGREVPTWVVEALPTMPEIMARSASRAGRYEAACVNLVEAALMVNRIGEVFPGIVVEVERDKPRGEVQLRNPAILARIEGTDLDLGEELMVRVESVSIPDRAVHFEQA